MSQTYSCNITLSDSIGVSFTRYLVVKSVEPTGQGAQQGITQGSRVVSVESNGFKLHVQDVQSFRAAIDTAKARGATTMSLVFAKENRRERRERGRGSISVSPNRNSLSASRNNIVSLLPSFSINSCKDADRIIDSINVFQGENTDPGAFEDLEDPVSTEYLHGIMPSNSSNQNSTTESDTSSEARSELSLANPINTRFSSDSTFDNFFGGDSDNDTEVNNGKLE